MPNYFFAEYHFDKMIIDAGIDRSEPEEFRISRDAWMDATAEELDSLNDLPLYTNQQVSVSDALFGDTIVRIRYSTPCITTLKEKP